MNYKDLPEPLVSNVTPRDARHYAMSAGWKRVEGINGKVAVYADPASDLDQIIIPLDMNAADYGRRMAEVVSNLADREGRPAAEILDDLLLPPSDVLRFRISDSETEGGSLPLTRGIDLLRGAKRALLASACSVIQPQTFHPRLSRTEAEELIEASRLGQTARGSYTVTVACPLNLGGSPQPELPLPLFSAIQEVEAKADEEPSKTLEVPFTRKVTSLLMRSLDRIVRAADDDDLAPLARGDSDRPPLSANLCDALLLMRPIGDRSSLTLMASWSRAIPGPSLSDPPRKIKLRRDSFEIVEELSRRLRPAKAPKPSHFIGLVDALFGGPDEEGLIRGDAQLLILNQEEVARARVTLDEEAYRAAWKAHGTGGYVSLNGILVFGGRSHKIEGVENFRLVADSVSTPP